MRSASLCNISLLSAFALSFSLCESRALFNALPVLGLVAYPLLRLGLPTPLPMLR